MKRKIYIRKRADTTHIKKELQDLAYDLTETKNSDTTIDEMWDNFENNIHRIMTPAYRKEWLARDIMSRLVQSVAKKTNKS